MNCPICNKVGLPDFTITPVICSQCESNLNGFALIEKTNYGHKKSIKKQKYKYILFLTFVISIFSGIIFYPSTITNNTPQITQNSDSIIEVFETKLKIKELEINKLQFLVTEPKEVSYIYIVKNGDNLSTIAYFFYNDWRMYKVIEDDNNLKHGDIIHQKDTLIINLKLQ